MNNMAHNGKGVGVGEKGSSVHDKQMPDTQKKTALREIQNGNVGSIQRQQESLLFGGGRSNGDAIKFAGTKQMTPEFLSGLPGHLSLAYNGENENVKNARLRFQLELDRGRQQKMDIYTDNPKSRNMYQLPQDISQKHTQIRETLIHQVPVTNSNHGTPVITFLSGRSSVPSFHGKQSNSTQIDSMSANDQLRTERFIRLHKILKQCDEGKQIEYIRMLLHLSPTQLSKHAVELEKRTIQLSIEEAKEVERMKALDILGKSVSANNPIQSTQ